MNLKEYLDLIFDPINKNLYIDNIKLAESIIPNNNIFNDQDEHQFTKKLYEIYLQNFNVNKLNVWGQRKDNAEQSTFFKLKLPISIFKKNIKYSTKYLDIGSGDGLMAYVFSDNLKLNVEMSDIDDYRLQKFKQIPFYKITPYNPIKTDKKYDIISCFHIIHHSKDFFDFRLNEIWNLLNPGGFLIIRESDVNSEYMKIKIILQHIYYEIKEITEKISYEEFNNWFYSRFSGFYFINIVNLIDEIKNISNNFEIIYKPKENEFSYKDRTFYLIIKKL